MNATNQPIDEIQAEPKARLCAVLVAYRKNGILMRRTARPVSSEDMARALAGK